MDVIGHDYELIDRNTGDAIAGKDIFLHDLTASGKSNVRGVEGAAPYNGS